MGSYRPWLLRLVRVDLRRSTILLELQSTQMVTYTLQIHLTAEYAN